MAIGQGLGGANKKGVIAVSCGTITCLVFLFLIGLAMFVVSGILFGTTNNDGEKYKFEHCSYSEDYDYISALQCATGYNTWTEWDYVTGDESCRDCDELRQEYDDWAEEQENMRIGAIVLLILSLLLVIGAIVMAILMCSNICKSTGGHVHRTQQHQPLTTNGVTMATTQQQQPLTTAGVTALTTNVATTQQQQAYPAGVSGYHQQGQPPPPMPTQPQVPPPYNMEMHNQGYQPTPQPGLTTPQYPTQPGMATQQYPTQATQQPYSPRPTQQYPPEPTHPYPPPTTQSQLPPKAQDTSYQEEHEYKQLRPPVSAPPAFNPDYV